MKMQVSEYATMLDQIEALADWQHENGENRLCFALLAAAEQGGQAHAECRLFGDRALAIATLAHAIEANTTVRRLVETALGIANGKTKGGEL